MGYLITGIKAEVWSIGVMLYHMHGVQFYAIFRGGSAETDGGYPT